MKRNGKSVIEKWHTIRYIKNCIVRVSEREHGSEKNRKILGEIITENFLNLLKNTEVHKKFNKLQDG